MEHTAPWSDWIDPGRGKARPCSTRLMVLITSVSFCTGLLHHRQCLSTCWRESLECYSKRCLPQMVKPLCWLNPPSKRAVVHGGGGTYWHSSVATQVNKDIYFE